ncbi:PorT family protein [Portibacter marinus]|uniref:PorT family protein n=1 Tax=Portibacter marinus TaxID=2898660 RepID=UPI001F231872|nr:PorT family protein [Portibacter marinus]
MDLKKIVVIFILSCSISQIQAQKVYLWLDAGLKGSYGPNMLVNADVLNAFDYSPKINGSYSFGGKFGLNFGEYYAVTFDGMYSQFKQQFTYTADQTSSATINEYRWTSFDLYPLFRYNRTINYVELGPRISWLQRAQQSNAGAPFTDISGDFLDLSYSAVLGFGWYAFGDDAFTAIVGVRMGYTLPDFVSEQGKANNQIDLGLVEGNASTNPAFVHLVFELNWGIGYYAKTVCGGRSRFFRF